MAWRAIQNTVGTSESLASLSHLAERLHWRLLAHSDQWGRLDGRPRKLRALCFPMLPDVTDEMVCDALIEMAAVDRIRIYEIEGTVVVEIVDFEKHQPREAFRKRADHSVFPDFRNGSGMVPDQVRKLFGISLFAGVSGTVPEEVRNGSGVGPEEKRKDKTRREETTTSSYETFVEFGWNANQARQADADPERALAWVEAARNPSVTNPPGMAWSGFKGGGWPTTLSTKPAYEWVPPACEECGNLVRDGHTGECSVGQATKSALAEFEEVGA